MGSARRPIGLALAASLGAASALAACRGILGIDGLPGPEPDAASEAANTDTESGCAKDLQLDPDNCGACGHRCCGSTCRDGGCVPPTAGGTARTLEMGSTLPLAIAAEADGGAVYWTHETIDAGWAIVRLAAGSAQPETIATGLGFVGAMQVGPDAVYATSGSDVVAIAPKDGPATVTTVVSGTAPESLTFAAGQLWWTDWGTDTNLGMVNVVSPDGGGAATIYSGQTRPTGVALSAGALVWTELYGGHDVVIGTPDGGPTQTFSFDDANSVPGPIVAVDGGVVFGDWTLGYVARLDLSVDGGAPSDLFQGMGASITGLATDGTNVYGVAIVSAPNGSLFSMPLDGSNAAQTLAASVACPAAVATDGRCIYWTNAGTCNSVYNDYLAEAGTGSVMSIERP